MSEPLIVFLKAPRVGEVKTRLAADIGAQAATEAYRRLVQTVLRKIENLKHVELRFTPADAEREIRPWLNPGWRAAPQCEGDLGKRLHNAFENAFAGGAERVVIIGSDCPYLTAGDICTAWEKLRTFDLVLGPAGDGGYWLIGLRAPQPKLFEDIPWSSDEVLGQTLARAKALGLTIHLLRILGDVDTGEDWREFKSAAIRGSPKRNRSRGAG